MTYWQLAQTMGAQTERRGDDIIVMWRGIVSISARIPTDVPSNRDFVLTKHEMGAPTFISMPFMESVAKDWVEKVFNEFFRP